MQSPYRGSPARVATSLVLALTMALVGCGDGAEEPEAGDPATEEGPDEEAEESAEDEGAEAAAEADGEPTDDDDGGELATDTCPLSSAEVSEIVGSTLEAGDPNSTINDGVTCAYLHETDLDPSVGVTVGNWDGTDESVDQLIDNNRERFGEPSDTPSDVGEHASLWNADPESQTTLIVFDGGRYYTTTVSGFEDPATSRDIVTSLYDAVS